MNAVSTASVLDFHNQTSSAFNQDMDGIMLQCVWNIAWHGEISEVQTV